jgi:2-methylcitrate dehydratase PrpD
MSDQAAPAFLAAWDDCARRAAGVLPPAVLEAARRSWFDTLAASAAGVVENCTRAGLQATGAASVQDLTPADAALVLGAAAHALDYDDVCMLATCHPSAPTIAALLALLPLLERQRPGLTLADLLAAYALGTETTLRLGEWLGFKHYALGFHATDTLGVVGAAAAAAQALRLPTAQAHAALAIAASHSAGLRANFGSDAKPLHVGFAAAAGVRSALLAQAGADASDEVWGPAGFFHAFTGGQPQSPLRWGRQGPWALERPGFEHKRFPSCYLTQRLIAGVLKIRARHPASVWALPVEIEIEVPLNGTAALKHPHATTGLQARFSGHYCAAVAWRDGKVELASFTDAAVQRPQLQALMRRVALRERGEAGESLDTAPVHVTVGGDGWSDRIAVDWAPGSPSDAMTRDELLQKWRDCAVHGGLATDPARMLALLDAPPATPAAAVLLPLRQGLLAAVPRSKPGETG